MTIKGVSLPIVDLTLPLPKVRKDDTELALGDIQSVTILRDGRPLTTLTGPFHSETVTFTDTSPATGSDIYSYFVTDTAGVKGDHSASVAITITGETPKAPPAAGTLKAVAKPVAVVDEPATSVNSPTASGYLDDEEVAESAPTPAPLARSPRVGAGQSRPT